MNATQLVLGSAQWGTAYGIANKNKHRPAIDEVARMLELARASGVCAIDTARAYGDAEAVIGETVGSDPDWRVFTKLTPELSTARDASDAVDVARRSLDESRRSLRRDRLDAVLLHRPEHKGQWGGAVWDVLQGERNQGRIGGVGISATSFETAMATLDDRDNGLVQVAASLLDQRLLRAGFFDAARSAGMNVLVRSIFLQGAAFLDPAALPVALTDLTDPLEDIKEWSACRSISVWEAFIAHARSLDVHLVIGFEKIDQLATVLPTLNEPNFDHADLAELASLVPDLPATALDPSSWPVPGP